MYRRRSAVTNPNVNAPFKPLVPSRPGSSSSDTGSSSNSANQPAKNNTPSVISSPSIIKPPTQIKRPLSALHQNENNNNLKPTPLTGGIPGISSNSQYRPVGVKRTKPEVASQPFKSALIAKPTTSETQAKSSSGSDKYFEVLWRKVTNKKNKTWDGDGVLIASSDGTLILENSDGKQITKSRSKPFETFDPDYLIKVGFYEAEISGTIDPQVYLSGSNHLAGSNLTKPSAEIKRPPILKNKPPTNDHFTSPLNGTLLAYAKSGASKSSLGASGPRHNPEAPNAIVLPRPSPVPVGKKVIDVVIDPLLAKFLRPHQVEGVRFLYECIMGYRLYNGRGALLADEMGLGKTLMTITLIWTLLKQTPIMGDHPTIKRALIVCPVTLIANWKKEFKKWLGSQRVGVFVADGKADIKNFVNSRVYQVIIVGYERLRTISIDLKKASIDLIVCDEGHRLKSQNNKSAQAILTLPSEKRIILSGTPIQNDLGEFFSMVDFLNPGILGTYATFKRVFEIPILNSRQPEATPKDIEKGQMRSEELSKLTRMFTLRRTADALDKYLPPKTDMVIFCKAIPKQAELYQKLVDSSSIKKCLGSNDASEHLRAITILKKMCNSPSLLRDSDFDLNNIDLPPTLPYSSGKLRFLIKFLRLLYINTSEKVVIVSGYTQTLDIIEDHLRDENFSSMRLDGSTATSKRQQLVDKFNTTDQKTCFVFLLSSKSGGAGINLIGASRLFLYDTDWNPSVDLQAMARVHRDGQKRPVFIYRLLLTGTIDEKIYQRQITKQGLADSFMDPTKQDTTEKKKKSGGKSSSKNSAAATSSTSGKSKKSGGSTNTFSMAELQDLFTYYSETPCHTHDLIACDCQTRFQRDSNVASECASPSSQTGDVSKDANTTSENPNALDLELMSSSSEIFSSDDEENGNNKKKNNPNKDTKDNNESDDEDEEMEDEKISNRLGGWTTARDVAQGTAPIPKILQAKSREKMKYLFDYKHYDPKVLLETFGVANNNSSSLSSVSSSIEDKNDLSSKFFNKKSSQEEKGDDDDDDDDVDEDIEEIKNDEEDDEKNIDMEVELGDSILTQLIRDPNSTVSFIFTKSTLVTSDQSDK